MNQVVYVDVLILENFFMNYLLLYIINRFCKCKAKWWRLSIASFVGALYVLILFFPDLHIFYSVLMKFMMPMIMIVVAFSPYSIREFIKILILFYVEAFIVAGSILGFFYLSNQDMSITSGAFLINDISSNYIIIGSLIAIVMVKLGFDYFENYYSMEK
jgi:stage II sporulation protein GA (sporulation sigma-E factor processing peptidase)